MYTKEELKIKRSELYVCVKEIQKVKDETIIDYVQRVYTDLQIEKAD